MNEEGEYIKKTMCNFCQHKETEEEHGYLGICMYIEKGKCALFKSNTSKE